MVRAQEISLPQTESAFSQLAANSRLGMGDHLDYHLTAGDIAVELGSEPFDPAYHDPADIDFTLEDSVTDGGLYVPSGLTIRPLAVGVVHDLMNRSEDPRVNKLKRSAADLVVTSVQAAVPQTDPINGVSVTDLQVSTFDFHEVVKVSDRPTGVRKIEDIAMNGLSVIVSDFQNMEFSSGSLKDAVAVKVNHLFERRIPQDIGIVSLGDGVEINTRKPRQLNSYNQFLDEEHEETIDRIRLAGGQVLSVVIDPRFNKPYGFSRVGLDEQLASAIGNI